MDIWSDGMITRVPAILVALTVHELAHGAAARALGDDTAERAGRLTLNPLAHLDLFGTLMLLYGPFGWAKPVPVDPRKLRNPRWDMALVAVAGPLSNIALAAATGLLYRLDLVNYGSVASAFLSVFFLINIGLAVFNLLPIHPLDGSRILVAFLSEKNLRRYAKVMAVAPIVFLGMICAEWVLNKPILSYFLEPVFRPAFHLAKTLFIGP